MTMEVDSIREFVSQVRALSRVPIKRPSKMRDRIERGDLCIHGLTLNDHLTNTRCPIYND